MANEQAALSASIDSFFTRCGLDPRARLDCHLFVKKLFLDEKLIEPIPTQGYCSYTVSIEDQIVQFRPPKYALDLSIISAARTVYGSYAPSTTYCGTVSPHNLLVYIMDKMPGTSYHSLTHHAPSHAALIRTRLCEDFATFLARAWHHQHRHGQAAVTDPSPLPLGTIGSSLTSRLTRLRTSLPPRFRPTVARVIAQYALLIEEKREEKEGGGALLLPTVLTHGDIVASNILLDPADGKLFGLVDWAEAEPLPFGICLYGLEEILGRVTTAEEGFVYWADAERAREAFWRRLRREIPLLVEAEAQAEAQAEADSDGDDGGKKSILEAVLVARDMGVLLWYGFAFDDGAIDRVVQEGRDWKEICHLDALLLANR